MLQTNNLPDEVEASVGRNEKNSEASHGLLETALALSAHKALITLITFSVLVLAAIWAWFLPDTFQAQAVIMTPQQQQSSLSAFAAGALGTLAGSGVASQLGLKNPSDLYIGLMKSRTVLDEIIREFHLAEVYQKKLQSKTRAALLKNIALKSGADSFITISVEDHDPKRASAMANAFVNELYKQTSRLAFTDASQRRIFFEQQIQKEKEQLVKAETSLQETQRSTGLLLPSGQSEVLLRSTAEMRAGISSRQVALQSMRAYATDENAQVQLLQREISTMQAQLTQLESRGPTGSSFEVSVGKLPAASLEYLRKVRDLKYQETMFEVLSKQYEAARIDEAKEAPVIQVVDMAEVPDHKAGPARSVLVVISGLVGFILSSCYVVLKTHWDKDGYIGQS